MKQKKISVIVLMLVTLAVMVPLSALGSAKGQKAPEFTLTLSGGKKVSLADYKGKTVFLHFWATWCPPCRDELPGLDAFAVKTGANSGSGKLVFLAVCVSDTEKSRKSFMQKNGYTFTGALDSDGGVADLYGVDAIPTTVLIGPDGVIQEVYTGAVPDAVLASLEQKFRSAN